jgi:4-amino-4-deoxy-L-arabinose transferase-like glycosyltransferase
METRQDGQQSGRLKLLLIVAVVLAMRLPFLNQAVQGDDVYYLAEAEHAQIEPLHPAHFKLVYLGNLSDMRGHSHPPMNAWILGGLLAAFGDIREVPFHAAYIVFSLAAALAMWSLARRFSPHPLWATLLFLAVPAFVINGNSFETDLPFLAFWMASVALFVTGRYLPAALTMALAALTAYQAIFLTPILWLYLWLFDRKRRPAWAVALTPLAVVAAYQIFERVTTGAVPAAVLTGYFKQYGFQALGGKVRNALGLTIHACWLVFPALLPAAAILVWRDRRDRRVMFLLGWIALFFAGALVVFFAGSARYLLPMAAPVVLLVSSLRKRWLAAGFAIQLTIGLALAAVNYQHWAAYRPFAASLPAKDHRIWINGDWGLRYYVEAEGGLPLQRNQSVRPGDIVVTTALGYPIEFTTGGGKLAPLAQMEVRPSLPLRLVGLGSRSGYSNVDHGFLPFDISNAPVDRVRAEQIVKREPTREDLPMNAPEAQEQIVSGVYAREGGNAWRWTSGRAVILLKKPEQPKRLRVSLYIHDNAPARKVTLLLDGVQVAQQQYPGPGKYVLEAGPATGSVVTIVVDQTFSVPGDSRELGIILSEVGFS